MPPEAAEAHELSEKIREAAEEEEERVARAERSTATLRQRAAIAVGVLAALLAIATTGGAHATNEMIFATIQADDTYNFYQAKNIRQTDYNLAADQMQALLIAQPGLPTEAKAQIQKNIDSYKATSARYESEPSTGQGKQELLAQARRWEAARDHYREEIPNFHLAEALFQIGIVLGSVSIVASSQRLLFVGVGLGVVAVLLALNGFFLFTHLPFVGR